VISVSPPCDGNAAALPTTSPSTSTIASSARILRNLPQ
jgi:hypothetical protein